MKTVFLVVPRRISIRYLLSGDFYDILKSKKDVRVIILTSIKDEKFIKEFSDENIFVEYIPMRDGREIFFDRALRSLRNYFGGAYYDLATFDTKARMRGRLAHMLYRALVLISKPFGFLSGFMNWLDINLASRLFDSFYEVLFQKYQPDLVFIHSVYELTAVPVARLARRKKIPSIGVVLSWDNLTNKGVMYARCDKIIVWNEIMKKEAIKYYNYASDDIFIAGTPQFDFCVKYANEILSKEEFFSKVGLDINKKLIVHTTVPERIGGETEIGAINAIYEAIKNNRFIKPCQLLIRIYTRDDPRRYEKFKNLPGLILDNPGNIPKSPSYKEADKYFILHLAATMKYADAVINIVSTTSIDAAIFDTPVVNVAFNKLRYWYQTSHYPNLVKTGGVKIAYSPEELIKYINQYLENPRIGQDGRRKIVNEQCFKLDGRSAQRIAEYLFSQLKLCGPK